MSNRSLRRFQLGFTIVELLVVVTIIALVIAAGLVFFINAQRNGRDSRRQADMSAISDAYEQYFTLNGIYPMDPAGIDNVTFFPSSARPVDPRNSGIYVYSYSVGEDGFCVCAALDQRGKGNATAAAPTTGTECSFGTPAANAQGYYCVQSSR